MEQIYIEIYLKIEYIIYGTICISHFPFHCFMGIYLNGCNNSADNNPEDGVDERSIYFTRQRRRRSTDVVVCLLIWFVCSSRCGVAAATLLAKDEPIKRSFQTEPMCALTDSNVPFNLGLI